MIHAVVAGCRGDFFWNSERFEALNTIIGRKRRRRVIKDGRQVDVQSLDHEFRNTELK